LNKSKRISVLLMGISLALCVMNDTSAAAADNTVRINFQTKHSQTPDGFLADNGDVYGERGNGQTYGWNRGKTGSARDYSLLEPDRKLATLNQLGKGDIWEIAVPDGTYEVTVGIGDIKFPDEIKGKLLLLAEDATIFENKEVNGRWQHVKPKGQTYASNTVQVDVQDGKLTLDPKDSVRENIKVNYIEIKSLAGPIPGASTAPADGSSSDSIHASMYAPIEIFVNGKGVKTEAPSVMRDGRVMVPVRIIAEAMGADVSWSEEKNAVLINSMPGQARLKEKTTQLIVNGLDVKPDVPPFLLSGSMMVPVRWVSEALGLEVTWAQDSQSVYVNEKSHNKPAMDLQGWASVQAEGLEGTTGGGDAALQTVTTLEELEKLAGDGIPRTIVISGTISTGVNPVNVKSNKTIIGENKYATIRGGISIDNSSNVIIRNLNFQGYWPIYGPTDTIAARESHHLWFDHLNIWDASDGLLDLTQGSNYVTISWSKFFYTDPDHPHRLASLNGGGAEHEATDTGKNKVTYHHNWFANHIDQRMPRILFGQGHVYNNYYTSSDSSYAIGVGVFASVLVENNFFKNVKNPHQFMYPDRRPAHITAEGNIYENTKGSMDTGATTPTGYDNVAPFTHPIYKYQLDDAKDVPYLVARYAGPQ
jgi:pectate lyase